MDFKGYERALVTGANGFIGSHLVDKLVELGFPLVRGVDIQARPDYARSLTEAHEEFIGDLRDYRFAEKACDGMDIVFGLAADMGGMGFIQYNHTGIFQNNTRINFNTVDAAVHKKVRRYFFSSSVCVYPQELLLTKDIHNINEERAVPAHPQDAYGWEKLMMEQLLQRYQDEGALEIRIARYNNTYGPRGTWHGGREKAPAALCRKVALASSSFGNVIRMWGDGRQMRTFTYISDTVDATLNIAFGDNPGPYNVGSEELITINGLLEIIEAIADVCVEVDHVQGPEGARIRLISTRRYNEAFPTIWTPLVHGLTDTYTWMKHAVHRYIREHGSDAAMEDLS